jgi:hypothetical protein
MTDEPETLAVSKALDMAYKIKGTYSPEKRINMTINVSEELKQKLNALMSQAED